MIDTKPLKKSVQGKRVLIDSNVIKLQKLAPGTDQTQKIPGDLQQVPIAQVIQNKRK